jgi:IMP dehydrogenase
MADEWGLPEGLTFDDVLILPGYSEVVPSEVDTSIQLTPGIRLNIPILSAAMDTVTESRLAISLAQAGGLGAIHKNMPIEEQARQVDQVKRSESGMISNPITLSPEDPVSAAVDLTAHYKISGVPITDRTGKLVGILTNRDLRFETNFAQPIANVMTSKNLVTAPEGTSLEEAQAILGKHRIEKLPIVNEKGELRGLITIKDIEKKRRFPSAAKDGRGRLLSAAAVGVGEDLIERASALVEAGVDMLVVDSAHGHSKMILAAIGRLREKFPDVAIMAGNVGTSEGAEAVMDAGAHIIKVGIGPGSICTTRVVTGAGVPQITAIQETAKAADKRGIPIVADGGIKYSGDITKAIAAGASAVMIGSLFAATEEAPGETVYFEGRTFKEYRGMGSLAAMEKGGKERYFQVGTAASKLVPEGVEGRVPYKGVLQTYVYQLVGGLRAGMGYAGAGTVAELRAKGKFIRITDASLRESHPHDIVVTKEAPNYRLGE